MTTDIITQIAALKEDHLRDKILIPMLRVIGAYHVEKYHGSDENGKDVYFAYKDIFGEYKHCCLFIKAGHITKSGKNDIRKMKAAIEEAMLCEFVSPLDNKSKIKLEEFYFVCSGNINKPAREYLFEMINKHCMPNTRIYDLDKIVKVIISTINTIEYQFNVETYEDFCNKLISKAEAQRTYFFDVTEGGKVK